MVHKTNGGGANKKKGISIEEKIEKVEKWFHAHPHPYTLKELMNLIPKHTGVLYQSIEECLELLESENRIEQDKVGIHTLFWQFAPTQWQREHPNEVHTSSSCNNNSNSNKAKRISAAEVERARLLSLNVEQLRNELEEATKQYDAITAELDALRINVGSDAEIQKDQEELNALVQRKLQLTSEREKYAKYDPELPERLKCNIDAAIEAINQWTDNYFILEEYISKHTNMNKREIRQRAHVPADYDYVDKSQVYDLSTLKMLVRQLREPEEMEQTNTNCTEQELYEEKEELFVEAGREDTKEEVIHDETSHMEISTISGSYAKNKVCKLPVFKTARELCVGSMDEVTVKDSDELESTAVDDIENNRKSAIHNCNTIVEEESEAANAAQSITTENKSYICDEDDDAAKVKEQIAWNKRKQANKRKRNSVVESNSDACRSKSTVTVNVIVDDDDLAESKGAANTHYVESETEVNDTIKGNCVKKVVESTKESTDNSPQPQGQQRRRKRN